MHFVFDVFPSLLFTRELSEVFNKLSQINKLLFVMKFMREKNNAEACINFCTSKIILMLLQKQQKTPRSYLKSFSIANKFCNGNDKFV